MTARPSQQDADVSGTQGHPLTWIFVRRTRGIPSVQFWPPYQGADSETGSSASTAGQSRATASIGLMVLRWEIRFSGREAVCPAVGQGLAHHGYSGTGTG